MSAALKDRIACWLENLPSTHHRWMMRYLRSRGWVVFYLDPEHRECSAQCCWLRIYVDGERREGRM